MQSNELLRTAIQHAHTLTMPLIEDLRTAHFVSPAPGGHHGHSVVGHLLFSEGRFQQIMLGSDNVFEDLQSCFGGQSVPSSDASGSPDGSIAELLVIRPLWWLQGTGAAVGGSSDIGLHETGLSGEATVLAIGPCDVHSLACRSSAACERRYPGSQCEDSSCPRQMHRSMAALITNRGGANHKPSPTVDFMLQEFKRISSLITDIHKRPDHQ